MSSPSNIEESSRSTVSKSTASPATLRGDDADVGDDDLVAVASLGVEPRLDDVVVVDPHAELVEGVADGERGDPRLRDFLAATLT